MTRTTVELDTHTTEPLTDTRPSYDADLIRAACAETVKYPPSIGRENLRWGWRLNNVDMVSSYGYRWPYPGHWAEAPGPILEHTDSCCHAVGDGICAAHTIGGATSSGAKFGRTIGLLVAWTDKDVLGGDASKTRLRRAWVADTFDPVRFLTDANLRAANLRDANLMGADLRAADLRAANITDANLTGANLTGANLTGANLTGADLRAVNLTGANLRAADLRAANITGADLTGANITDANLTAADLWGADLRDANLRDANLKNANLTNADLTAANLQYADLTAADLRSANLTGVCLTGARYSRMTLWPARFNPAAHGCELR